MSNFHIIKDIFDVSIRADRIRSNEERRLRSIEFAISSIIYSILAVAFAVGGGLLFTISTNSLLFIFLIVIGVVLLIGAIVTFIGALVRAIAQLRINRRAIGWVALAVLILSFIGAIIGVLLILM